MVEIILSLNFKFFWNFHADDLRVVALATGNKCVGPSAMSSLVIINFTKKKIAVWQCNLGRCSERQSCRDPRASSFQAVHLFSTKQSILIFLFLSFTLQQLVLCTSGKSSVYFEQTSLRTFAVRNGVRFHFYVSQTPCEKKKKKKNTQTPLPYSPNYLFPLTKSLFVDQVATLPFSPLNRMQRPIPLLLGRSALIMTTKKEIPFSQRNNVKM